MIDTTGWYKPWPLFVPPPPKPHIRKLDTGSWGFFDSRASSLPSYVANDIRTMQLWVLVKPLPFYMRRYPEFVD